MLGRAKKVILRQVRIGIGTLAPREERTTKHVATLGRGSHVAIKKADNSDGGPGQDGWGGTMEEAVSGRLGS